MGGAYVNVCDEGVPRQILSIKIKSNASMDATIFTLSDSN
jgi:hypothetical protein